MVSLTYKDMHPTTQFKAAECGCCIYGDNAVYLWTVFTEALKPRACGAKTLWGSYNNI